MSKRVAKTQQSFWRRHARLLVQIGVLLAAIIILTPQFIVLSHHLDELKNVQISWLVVAFGAIMVSNFFAAGSYMALASEKLPLGRTALVQLASLFANRILPSGLGSLGLNTLYLNKSLSISKTSAATIAGTNNVLGIIAFNFCFGLALIFSSTQLQDRVLPHVSRTWLVTVAAIILAALVFCIVSKSISKKIKQVFRQALITLRQLLKKPDRVLLAILANAGITACYVAALWCSAQAAGINIDLASIFIVFAVGNLALAVSPTPGGLGPTELALIAALATIGVGNTSALIVVIGFRVSSYWLPVIPGYLAFRHLVKQKYI